MKVSKLLTAILFFSFFSITLFSQVKITSNGEAKIGNEWTSNQDPNNDISIEAFGLNTASFRPGAKMSFGDYGVGQAMAVVMLFQTMTVIRLSIK